MITPPGHKLIAPSPNFPLHSARTDRVKAETLVRILCTTSPTLIALTHPCTIVIYYKHTHRSIVFWTFPRRHRLRPSVIARNWNSEFALIVSFPALKLITFLLCFFAPFSHHERTTLVCVFAVRTNNNNNLNIVAASTTTTTWTFFRT